MSLRFYDSNIFLYAYSNAPEELRKREIAQRCLLDKGWCISAQVLQEFYANAIRNRPKHAAMLTAKEAAAVVALIEPHVRVSVDSTLVQQGVALSQQHQLSYWDGAIIAAALRCGADELLTEDLNAGQMIEGVRIVNPFAQS